MWLFSLSLSNLTLVTSSQSTDGCLVASVIALVVPGKYCFILPLTLLPLEQLRQVSQHRLTAQEVMQELQYKDGESTTVG